MAKAKSEALVKKATSAALEPWEADLAKEAVDEKAKESLGVPRITHKGGEFKIDNNPVKPDARSIKLAVVDFKFEKCFYEGAYDPQNPATPDCYAFGDKEETMVAHPSAPNPQNKKEDGTSPCTGCQHNVFGTATVGRGKRCKDYRRLLVVAPVTDDKGALVVDAKGAPMPIDTERSEKRQLQIPPGSLKNWGNYLSAIKDMSRTGNVREMIMQVDTYALQQGGHGLKFTPVRPVSQEGLKRLLALRAASQGLLTQAYPVISTEDAEAAAEAKKAAKKIRGKLK